MKAKEMAFDFLETVFFLFCIIFFIFYLFFGNHLGVAKKIFETAGAISIFGALLIIRWKFLKKEIKKKEKDFMETDIVTYLEKKDIIKDRFFIFFVSITFLLIAQFSGTLNSIDVVQAFSIFIIMGFFHLTLFSKQKFNSSFISLTQMDEMKDRILLMLLTMILLLETLLDGGATMVDFSQIIFVFASFYYWHKHLFKC